MIWLQLPFAVKNCLQNVIIIGTIIMCVLYIFNVVVCVFDESHLSWLL